MAYMTYAEDVVGSFTEVDAGCTFEYSLLNAPLHSDAGEVEYPHKIWVASGKIGGDSGWRYGRVMKSRFYIVTDEDDNGLVVQKWYIKNHRNYAEKG